MYLPNIPLWLLSIAIVLIVLISIEAGFRLGIVIHRRLKSEKESPVSVISSAILGLLAFMLTFTFGIVYSRFETRKELVREEANTIGRVWLRSDFMSEPDHSKTVSLLSGYLDLRLAAARSQNLDQLMKTTSAAGIVQDRLWILAVANARKDMNSDVAALYIESLNELIDLHSKRLAIGADDRLPVLIWMALYTLLLLGMVSIGYLAAITNSNRTLATFILALSFSIVFVLITALDRPLTGLFRVSQQPLTNMKILMSK
jgi:hypothetical protein